MSPQLKSVEKAGLEAISRKNHPFDIAPTDFFEPVEILKRRFAELISAGDPSQISLIPSVSYGIASVAKNAPLSAGDEIVLIGEQFPSNVYAWMEAAEANGASLRFVDCPGPGQGKAWNERILEAIHENTSLVALAHFHWATGTRFDLQAIRARTREVGAWMVIDGTQSVGAYPFSVTEFEPDALVCAGYKWLMGPYSLGMAYYGPVLNDGKPIEQNWINRKGSEDFTNLFNYQPAYGPGASRYSMGEKSNFIQAPMLTTAIEQLIAWTPSSIQAYTQRIAKPAWEALQALGCTLEAADYRAGHMFGVFFPQGFDTAGFKERLKRKKISVGFRGNAMRVSPHVYNTEEEMAKLVSAVKSQVHAS